MAKSSSKKKDKKESKSKDIKIDSKTKGFKVGNLVIKKSQ